MYAELAQRLILAAKRVSELESEDRRLETELSSAKKETEEVLAAAETLENTVLSLQTERDDLKVQLEGLQIDLTEQLQSAQEENRTLNERLERSKVVRPVEVRAFTPKKERREGKSPLRMPMGLSPHPVPKELSLRQLKDFIEELYVSKPKFDQKFLEAKQPRETMEQHMMGVLNQKYGLKTIIAEWVTNAVKGIQHYSSEDNDVATFGCILRNEVEEEFRFVQKQVKSSIAELLRLRIKTDFPYIQEKAAKELLTEKMNGELDREEWMYVVAYMYNETDRAHLETMLQALLRTKENQTPRRYFPLRAKRQPSPTPRLSYLEVLTALLDFQLQGHERFLAPFLARFRKVDEDGDGILTGAQFRRLLGEIGLGDQADSLVEQADPIDSNNITYSDCIGLLSTVTPTQVEVQSPSSDAKMSVLQHLFSSYKR